LIQKIRNRTPEIIMFLGAGAVAFNAYNKEFTLAIASVFVILLTYIFRDDVRRAYGGEE
jgi:hypothetical protein